jgi:hypothetical protein
MAKDGSQTSFFNQFHLPLSTNKLSTYNTHGLNVVYEGYLLRFGDEVNISPTANSICLFVHGHSFPYSVYAPDSTWENMAATTSDPLINGKEVIWRRYVSQKSAIILYPMPMDARNGFGVLVTIQEQVMDTLFSRFEATVILEGQRCAGPSRAQSEPVLPVKLDGPGTEPGSA